MIPAIQLAKNARDDMRADLLRDRAAQLEPMPAAQAWTVDHATAVLRLDYYDDVRGVAWCLLQRIEDGDDIFTAEQLDEALREAIDGSARVIYTWQARLGLLASDNEGACEDETGEAPTSPEVAMFWAMRADVREMLPEELWADEAWEESDADGEEVAP